MKKWSAIIAATLVGAWMVVNTVREFFANETIRYFTAAPHRLLYVFAIALWVVAAVVVFDRLSARTQRNVVLFSWGGAAVFVTVLSCFMLYLMASTPDLIFRNAGMGSMIVPLLALALLAAYLWFEFFRTWKTRASR